MISDLALRKASSSQPSSSGQRRIRWVPQKLQWWYEAIIDLMLANPEITKKEIAKALDSDQSTIYVITRSDMFLARFAERREQFNAELANGLSIRLQRVAGKSLEILEQVMEEKRTAVPIPQLVDITDKVLSRLGYGQSPPASSPGPQVNVHVGQQVVVPVTSDDLAEAREALRRSEQMRVISGIVSPPERSEPHEPLSLATRELAAGGVPRSESVADSCEGSAAPKDEV